MKLLPSGALPLWCSGCSLLSERLPPRDPGQLTGLEARHCSDYKFALADTLSTAASIAWIVYANQKIDENGPQPGYVDNQLGGTDYVPPSSGNSSNVRSFELLRASAYASASIFAVSAIYGWVVEARCQALKKERRERENPPRPVDASARRAFPSDVLGFGFEFQPAQAGLRCAQLGGAWSFDANVGFCLLALGPAPKPDVRIDFELGVPAQIALIYPAPAE